MEYLCLSSYTVCKLDVTLARQNDYVAVAVLLVAVLFVAVLLIVVSASCLLGNGAVFHSVVMTIAYQY